MCLGRGQLFRSAFILECIHHAHNHNLIHILDFSWPLAIALGFKLPIKIAQFGFKVPAIWSRCSGSLQSCQYKHTVSSRPLYKLLRMSTDTNNILASVIVFVNEICSPSFNDKFLPGLSVLLSIIIVFFYYQLL